MLNAWTSSGKSGNLGVAKDTRTLSQDVLAATGFRTSYLFRSSTDVNADEARSFRNSLAVTLDNALFMMLVPAILLSVPFMPKTSCERGKDK